MVLIWVVSLRSLVGAVVAFRWVMLAVTAGAVVGGEVGGVTVWMVE